MAAQALFADTVGLANRPVPPNAVQWSEDGVLAVAAAHSVVLLSPGDLQGPRAFASPGNMCEPGLLQAAGQPVNPTADAHHEVAHLRVAAMVSQYPALQAGLTARSVAWSPAGCAQAGGCLLAVVASDHQVLVYGPPPGPQNEWQQVADLSQQLLEHSEETGWRDAEQDAGAAAPAGATQDAAAGGADGNVLRLRGGGKRKRPSEKRAAQPPAQAEEAAPAGAAGAEAEGAFEPAVGQAVEVMSIDEGLAGCWFTGTIQELYRGWALVAYDELKEAEEEGSAALKEWFAVPGQRQGKAPPAKPPGAVHGAASGALLRPAPPLQDLEAGRARAPGEVCDCLIEGGWWELCKVVDAPSQAKGSGSGSESGCQVVLEWGSERERHTATLLDCRNTLRFADGRWELWHGPVPAEASTDAAAAAAAAGSSQEAAPQPPEQQRQQQEQVVGGADGGSGEAGSPAKKRRPRKPSAGRKAAAGDGEAVQEEPAAAAAAAAAEAEAEAAEPPNKRRKGGRGPSSSSKNQPASAGGKPGADLAMAAAAVAADAFLSGASSAAGKGKRASTAGGGAASAKQKTPAKAAAAAYEVPADFDASVLPSVDLSGAKEARASLPLAFCRRFLALRREVPQEELPTYPYTSSHLKGRDAELVAQVVAELLHAHGPALAAVAPPLADAKWLNTDGRQKLNKVWDRTCNRLLGKFTIAEGEAPEEEPEEEEEETEEEEEEEEAADGEQMQGDGEGGQQAQRRTRGRGGKTSSALAKLDFEPHQILDGFSWRELPGVDPSNEGSAKGTLLLAAVRRFLTLRGEYEEEELPTYATSSTHLKGRDLWLVDRVTREFVHSYSQLFSDVGWDVKAFQTYWLNRLRLKWDRVRNKLQEGFTLDPEPVEQDVLLAIGDSAAPPPSAARSAAAAAAAATPGEASAAWAQDGAAAAAAAAMSPPVGRGPRLQNRPSARRPKGAGAGRRGRASSAAAGESDHSEGTALTVSSVRKKKELSAATAQARSRRTNSAPISSQAYQRRLLGISALCCAWSPAVTLPAAAAAEVAAEAAGAAAEAAGVGAGDAAGGPSSAAGQQPQHRCCFLAVGAKAGRVWLWRYRLPGQYSVQQPQGGVDGLFQLVSCFPGPAGAWVTSLTWQLLPAGGSASSSSGSSGSGGGGSACSGSLVLAVGYSDGSVVLHGADAAQLAARAVLPGRQQQQQQQREQVAPAGQAMLCWGEALPPDQRSITALSLLLCPSSQDRSRADGQRLLVAAGKAAGSLAVWRSAEISCSSSTSSSSSTAEHAKALSRGAACVAVGVQGTRSVTGLAWLPHQQQQEGQPLLLAATQDGAVVCWRLAEAPPAAGDGRGRGSSSGVALVRAAGAPQPCGRRKKRDQGHCALGLALSPGGLFAAVVRLSLSPLAEMVKAMQIHEKVMQGVLQLDCLAGPDAPLEPAAALDAALDILAGPLGSTSPGTSTGGGSGSDAGEGAGAAAAGAVVAAAGAWELAGLLRLLAKPDPGLVPPLASALLRRLEQPVHLAVQQAKQEEGAEEVLSRVASASWRSLQLATALRHLLDPARVVRSQQQRAKKQPRKTGGASAVPPLLPLLQPKVEEQEEAVGAEAPMQVSPPAQQQQQQQPQQQQQAQQPQPLSPEQLAQHGAFASLMAAAVPLPAQQQQQQQEQQQQPARPPPPQQPPQQQGEDGEIEEGSGEQPQQELLADWQAATERNEMLLLQRQLHAVLAAALPGEEEEADQEEGDEVDGMQVDGRGAGAEGAAARGSGSEGEERRSQLLMADWITLNVQHPQLLPEMLPLAASMYHYAGEELPTGTAMPAREESSLFCGAPVAVAGGGVAAATEARIVDGASLPRCPASLLLCERRPQWDCRACGRKYSRPAAAAAAAGGAGSSMAACAPAVPACIFCGLQLGPSRPSMLLNPPCCS